MYEVIRLGLRYFPMSSYDDLLQVAIVAFVPLIMSFNVFSMIQFNAGWSGLVSKYLVVTSLVRCSRSFVYSRFVHLSWNALFRICHLLRAKNMVCQQRLVAQICEVWCRGSLTPFEESSVYHLSCVSFHWEEMWPVKKLFHPIAHWSSKALWMVSWIGSFVVQLRVGVVPPVR